jgi:hypothetical protein
VAAFTRYRTDPWPSQFVMGRALGLARQVAATRPETAAALYDAITPSFAVDALDEERRFSRVLIARSGRLWDKCREALDPLEASLPWRPDMLRARAECYQRGGDSRANRATADLQAYLAAQPAPDAPPAPASPPGAASAPRIREGPTISPSRSETVPEPSQRTGSAGARIP